MEDWLASPQVISLVYYLLQAGESSDAEVFLGELAQRVPQHGDQLMTIAQQLEQKGIEKGRAEGMQLGEQRGMQLGEQRGIEKGEREATLKIARSMLQRVMPSNS